MNTMTAQAFVAELSTSFFSHQYTLEFLKSALVARASMGIERRIS